MDKHSNMKRAHKQRLEAARQDGATHAMLSTEYGDDGSCRLIVRLLALRHGVALCRGQMELAVDDEYDPAIDEVAEKLTALGWVVGR